MRRFFQVLKTIWNMIRRKRLARKHFTKWSKRVRSADRLSPQERREWYAEEEQKQRDYTDQLL